MPKMNKKITSATYVSRFESLFKCPICNSLMHVAALKSLVCENNHTFDFTKQGYVNLMTKQLKTKYDKDLFEERRNLMAENGFFSPLIKTIADVINGEILKERDQLSVLDTGCGEGSHLAAICEQVAMAGNKPVMGAGIDIAKDGILIAAKHNSSKIWAVADLANIPFRDHQFDVILNILSPSNYKEFNRLLRDDGLVIKVVPGGAYLKELRAAYFTEPEKQAYSNVETVEHFRESFEFVARTNVNYTKLLDHESIQSLVKMTPLSWTADETRVTAFLERDSADITVDLDVLIGRKLSNE